MFGKPDASPANSETSATATTGGADDKTDEAPADTNDDLYVQLSTPLSQRKVETGEEAEESVFSCRAKLYVLNMGTKPGEESGWKERGVGTLHVNTTKRDDTSSSSTAGSATKSRLVMRADGLLRVVLNLPLLKASTMVMAGMKSSLQSEKFVRVNGVESDEAGGKSVMVQYALKTGNADTAKALLRAIEGVIPN